MHRIILPFLLVSAAAMAADKPAPPLHFEAGVVLAGGLPGAVCFGLER